MRAGRHRAGGADGRIYYSAVSHAKNAGIITDESQVITGEQLRGMDEGL